MKGYIAKKGNRWYAVIYDGLDPVIGRERRIWHPAGTDRAEAETLAARLAAEVNGRNDDVRALTFGAYLTTRWLPGKRMGLSTSTWDGYRRKIDRHILPSLGRTAIRRLRPEHLELLYDRMLHPTDGRNPLAPKTVLDVHLIIRGALGDAARKGLVSRNVALVAHAPKLRSIQRVEQQAWTEGNGLYGLDGDFVFSAASLSASGLIGGRRVQCLTAGFQLTSHTDYALDADDRADVTALCERFGFELPPALRNGAPSS